MRTVPFFLILALSLSTLPAAPGSQDQDKQTVEDAVVSVTHFNGPDIPDFFAWQAFFERADYEYRLGSGYYKNWVKRALGIGAFLKDDPKFSERLLRLLPDQGMLVKREGERLRNEILISIRVRDLGSISAEEQHRRFLELTRQEVRLVQKAYEGLHDAILGSKSPQREAIWARIVEYVHNDIKNSMGLTRDNTPGDLNYWEVILEFSEVEK